VATGHTFRLDAFDAGLIRLLNLIEPLLDSFIEKDGESRRGRLGQIRTPERGALPHLSVAS